MSDIVKKILKSNVESIEVISELSVSELEKVITYTADKYYNSSNPVIADALYDILIDFLKKKDPKSHVLKNIGANVKSKNKVKLDYWLGSMNKIKYPSNHLELWTKKYKSAYNLSDKLDGVSALITYKHNEQIRMYTRGTSIEGMDITPLIKYLNLPDWKDVCLYCKKNTIKGITNLIAFRGEIIIKKDIFKKKWSDILKNGRNSVSGLVNSKTINPYLAKDTDLVVYEVVEPFYPIEKQLKIIKDTGFISVTNKTINTTLTFEMLSKYLKERRKKSEYDIDGIIITSCENHDRNIDGNPEYAFAFKDILEDQKAKTTVISIEWNVSKDGFIKPTILLKPVTIGGVEIKRVTGNNAKFIVENKIGPDAQVEIIRSGDVIPKIQKIIKISKLGKGSLPNMEYKWNETKVDIILDNYQDSLKVLIKNIHYFFSNLETKGLGEKNIEKMIDSGLDSIPKILAADKERLLMVEGFGEKTAENLVESIKKALINISLAKLMASSNKLGHGIGEEKIKQVLIIYPNLMFIYKKWSKKEFIDKIKEIGGWENKTATLLVTNFNEFIKFHSSISKYITIEELKYIKGEFTGKTFIFTGFRDKLLESKIEAHGGTISSNISKKTDYLIVKDQTLIDKPTDKVSKALSLGIIIITNEKLAEKLAKMLIPINQYNEH
jgi:DNA ligase (NAD+)